MSLIDKLSARLPFSKKEVELEYYFALNIGSDEITVALWTIEGKNLQILDTTSHPFSSLSEITDIADKLLDRVLGEREVEVGKILFGVPSSWLIDDNLKDEYLKILRGVVKELQLTPMAYVATANALVHFLEKEEGVPPTAIMAGFEKGHLTTTVVRAGKLDGVKIVSRGETSGADLEKTLLTFTTVETLPSKILIYDSSSNLEKLKAQLLSYPWMSKLSFLHFPKIDILGENLEIKSICLAGASEIKEDVSYTDGPVKKTEKTPVGIIPEETEEKIEEEKLEGDNFGFVVGDVGKEIERKEAVSEEMNELEGMEETALETEDFEKEIMQPAEASAAFPLVDELKINFNFRKYIPKRLLKSPVLLIGAVVILIILALYIFIPKADVKIFVEPKILEKDAQVIADPNQKTVDENAKIIPGQIVQTQVSGSSKDSATGQKEVGDNAKGIVDIINNTALGQSFSAGTILTTSSGIKFKLDKTASVSATLVDSDSKGIIHNVSVTAVNIGADGNIASETILTVGNYSASQFVAKAKGNFSGGTSKQVTVVSSDDQKRLLAKLSSDLRLQAQQQLQAKLQNKKIIQEALTEAIISKSYNKNIGDQASEFSLNLTAQYKGTAFDDGDLRSIVSKLVTTQVPDGFMLDLSNTETQADVSSVDKSGKVIFLAKFKAKLLPKIDTEKVKAEIRGKSVSGAENQIKSMDNVLGSDIKISPSLPGPLRRIPILTNHISIEVGLK